MTKKCILILVDGMRPDALGPCGHPFCDAFSRTGAQQLDGRCVMPSVTLPCHISLFHSVPPQRHGTLTNDYAIQVRPVRSLMELLHQAGLTTAMLYSWEQLRDIALPGNLSHSRLISLHDSPNTDTRLTDEALALLKAEQPDFTFLYLGETDEAGHAHGWMSKEYLSTLSNAWECIRRVAEATQDGYHLIVTADHGGHDRCHGTEEPEDMNIPIFVRTADGTPVTRDSASILDIAPTVCALLDCRPDRDWEGASLV